MVTLRLARIQEAKALAELAERTFRDTFADANTQDDMDVFCIAHYGEAIQAAEIASEVLTTIVIEEHAQLIAFMQLRQKVPPTCVTTPDAIEIQRLYVDKPWHGKGLAQRLMDEAARIALQKNQTALWLGVWEHNPRAIAFYQKTGFVVVGDHTFTLGSDPQRDLVMQKSLI